MTEVKYGQLWADKDSREVKAGKRQHLRVEGLDRFGARETWKVHLNNEDTGIESWVRQDRLVKRFRLVED